jgi:hypothetical protein
MDSKTRPSKVYTTSININNAKSEEDYTIEEETKNNQQRGENFVAAKLLHIGETIQHLTSENLPTYRPKNDQHYYVDMPQSPLVREQQLEDQIIVYLNEGSPKGNLKETQQSPNLTQESMRTNNLLSLPCLPTKHTKGK